MHRPAPPLSRLLLACCAGAFLLAACNGHDPAPPGPRPVVVESPQLLESTVGEAFPGSVRARVESDLSFRIPGKIAERRMEMGMRVSKGTVLAVLDPQDARLNLEAAKAAVSAAEADLWLAQEEEKRYVDLQGKGYVGQSLVDVRVSTRKLAEAKLEQARSQFNLSRNQSGYTALTTDADGVVTEVMTEVGNVVTAGQPVARVATDGEREVRIDVPEGRVEALKQAERIAVHLWSNQGRYFEGRLREISPQAVPTTRTHEARVTILEPDASVQLGASATVLTGSRGDGKTFRIRATALGSRDRQQAQVWRVQAGENGASVAQPVPVQVLRYLDGYAVITGELQTKDRLISAGVHQLLPGMTVEPIDRTAKAAL
jgi:multidrug efflux system membrane fusion protein